MPRFIDSQGRAWDLPEITARMLNKLRDEFKLDLRLALRKDLGALDEALGDDEIVCRVLWFLCRAQAQERGYAEETWVDLFDQATFHEAQVALIDAVWTFSRGPKTARKVVAALRAHMNWPERTGPTSTLNGCATTPPGSAESTRETTVSGG